MLYNSEYVNFTKCNTYQHAQYKPNNGTGRIYITYKKFRFFSIALRLQMLFIYSKTIEHMTWHYLYDEMDRVTVNPSNGKAWKQFNKVYSQFSMKL